MHGNNAKGHGKSPVYDNGRTSWECSHAGTVFPAKFHLVSIALFVRQYAKYLRLFGSGSGYMSTMLESFSNPSHKEHPAKKLNKEQMEELGLFNSLFFIRRTGRMMRSRLLTKLGN
jgi:hypothetical protein